VIEHCHEADGRRPIYDLVAPHRFIEAPNYMRFPRRESEVFDGLSGPPAVSGVTSATSHIVPPGHPQVVCRNTLGIQHSNDSHVWVVQTEYSVLFGPRLSGPCVRGAKSGLGHWLLLMPTVMLSLNGWRPTKGWLSIFRPIQSNISRRGGQIFGLTWTRATPKRPMSVGRCGVG